MTVPQPRPLLRKPLDAGVFQPATGPFRLHWAAEARPPGRADLHQGAASRRPARPPASDRVRISVRITETRNRFTRRAAW